MIVARSSRPSSIGSASSSPRRRSMLSACVQPLPRGLQHRGGCVDRDHPRHEGRQRGAHLPRAAAEIADDPVGLRQAGQRRQMEPVAEQFVADAIPLTGRRREEFLGSGAALAERRLQAPLILRRGGRVADLLADEGPQPPRGGLQIARHRVDVAGAFGPRRHPARIGQRLQMTADRRLRQLHHGAELRHRQLAAVEQEQQPAARGVGQRGEMIENRRGA